MDYEKVWSVNDLLKNRNDWSLSADSELLKHLQLLSENVIDKTRSTLKLLESFENDVDRTCLSVANISNRFKSLSDTQFIENKIQESPETESMIYEETKDSQNKDSENVSTKLKEALDNGLTVLSSHYDIITVSDSDSENEEPQEILLKSCNPFIKRRLPYIIGTNDFTKYDHLGLADSSSDDDEEEEDELADEVVQVEHPYDRANVFSKKKITNTIASAQIIRISSSDSDDSVISTGMNSRRDSGKDTPPENNSFAGKLAQSLPEAPCSFADHLNAALLEADVKRPVVDTDCRRDNSYSPPPFPVKSNNNFSSDEEKSDCGDSVSSRGSVVSRSSPCFLPSLSPDNYVKSSHRKVDELPPIESSVSKSVKHDEYARSSNTLITVGPSAGQNSDFIGHEEKKLSRALADEFKSTILAKKNSTLPSRSSIECNSGDSKSSSKNPSTGNNVADVNVEKLLETSEPFHNPHNDDRKGIGFDASDGEMDLDVSFRGRPHKSTLVSTVAPESSESSWHRNIADDDDDDDDDDNDDDNSDEWFNRAVSSKIPRNAESVAGDTFNSFKPPNFQNSYKSSVKETVKNVFPADSKKGIGCTSSIKEEPVHVILQSEKIPIEVEDVKKKYESEGDDDDDDEDDDDYLFTKKPIIASDKNKTNELYEILFNDSDIDDPIQALVEENKRRVEVNKSTDSEIFDNFAIMNKSTKDSEISNENEDFDNVLANKQLIISLGEETLNQENESVTTSKVERTVSSVSETHKNVLSDKNIPKSEVRELFSDSSLVSNIRSEKNETKKISSANVQFPEYDDVNFEKKEVKSNSRAVSSSAHNLSANTPESLKQACDFLQTNSNEPILKTFEKKTVKFDDRSSSLVNSVTCVENDGDQKQSSSTKASMNMKKELLPDSALISDFRNHEDHLLASPILSQKSSSSCCDEFSPDVSNNLETAIPHFSGNGSVPSEIIIFSDNTTNLDEENSCEQNIIEEETKSPLKTTKPGKLAVGRGVNINVKALLPTSEWSKPNPKMVTTGEVTLGDHEDHNSNSISTPVHSNLSSVTKNRTKIQSKRRPPTRRGRVAHMNEQSLRETSVVNESEYTTKDLDWNVHGPNSAPFCDPSDGKSTHVEQASHANLSADEILISTVAENVSKSISSVGTSNSDYKDANSLFDSIFCNDSGEKIMSHSTLAGVSSENACDSSTRRELLGKSAEFPTNSSNQENRGEKNVFSDVSENETSSSLIIDCKNVDVSNVWKVADAPQKSSSSSTLFDEDSFIVPHVSGNDHMKSVENSKKTGPAFKIEKEQINRLSCSTKREVISSSVSNIKSDLFADDDDEDFDKLFSSVKKPLKNLPSKNSSLFEDVDEDDRKLFGVKTPRSNKKEPS